MADRYLNKEAVEEAGLLSFEGVEKLFEVHASDDTSIAEKVQIDAVINHLIGVQVLHKQFVATDIPAKAEEKARELGWAA